ncbi:MAG: AIR synthase-related protein, partial [candidate division WOR-3 bacterium]
MKLYRVEIKKKSFDPRAAEIINGLKEIGPYEIDEVKIIDVYNIWGNFSRTVIERIAREILCDSVNEIFYLEKKPIPGIEVEVTYNPAVTDPVEDSVKKAIRDGGWKAQMVKTSRRYIFRGRITKKDILDFAPKILYNPLIQHISFGGEVKHTGRRYHFKRIEIDLFKTDFVELSQRMNLALNLEEMRMIAEYFKRLGRNPTDVEIETIAQTWSEHCKHKTFRGIIEYDGRVINDLLRSTVMRVTEELNLPWCLSVFHDNSGVIEFDDDYGVCFKVETHNHPSALEPYGGASTGIGGVIRDIIGTGRGAKPIVNTDVFCFGKPDLPYDQLPSGVLHPKRIALGVVAGVRDYGNRMGIPTASGTVYYDDSYTSNPLVFCGTVGIIKKSHINKGARVGDNIVLVGGRTGRDGIHGVTFASLDLTSESESMSSCVQIGNPIMEKKFLDTLLTASAKDLFSAITDCGGGGLSSAVGEMGKEIGVLVDLEKVPLKYQGLTYNEIWISEAQERMILAVPDDKLCELLRIFKSEDVEATVIGRFTGDKRLVLRYNGSVVADLDMDFLHNGLPRSVKKARAKRTD